MCVFCIVCKLSSTLLEMCLVFQANVKAFTSALRGQLTLAVVLLDTTKEIVLAGCLLREGSELRAGG